MAVPLWAFLFLELMPVPQLTRTGVFLAVLAVGIGPVAGSRPAGDLALGVPAFELNVIVLVLSIIYVPLMVMLVSTAFPREVALSVATVAKIVLGAR